MGKIILPSNNRRPVQLTGFERVVVLVHKDTNRILCFGRNDMLTQKMAAKMGCKVIEILHAHDYDRYAKIWREQAKEESAIDDAAYLERENHTRQALRKDLRNKLSICTDGYQRKNIESALHTLDAMERKRQRYRAESFLVQEGYEASANTGGDLAEKIMGEGKKPLRKVQGSAV